MSPEHESATYQLLPQLRPEEYAALKALIEQDGITDPILVDEVGTIIDGHLRAQIAAELGITCPRTTISGKGEHEKRVLAVQRNTARRHLTDAQKVLMA